MPQKKPTAVVVIAILQLLFGVLSLCGPILQLSGAQKAISSATQVQPPPGQPNFNQAELEKRMEEKVPSYKAMATGDAVTGLVLALMMIGSGVGLLQLQSWGRRLAMVYAVLSILTHLVGLILAFAVVLPAMSDFFKEFAAEAGGKDAAMMAQVMQGAVVIAMIFSGLVIVYPIIVIIVMLLPSVRAAFGGEAAPGVVSSEPEDYRDPTEPGGFSETDDRFQGGGR
jgi:hypothetical protein